MATIQQQYGSKALRKGLPRRRMPPHISTSFAQFDAATGCGGIPLGQLTLLSGPATSGKLTVAYKMLASAKSSAILDLNQTTDADYLQRCGLNLDRTLVVRPDLAQSVPLLLDLVHTRELQVVLVDSLANLTADSAVERQLRASLDRLVLLARQAGCAVVLVDEASPPWLRFFHLDRSWLVRRRAALHVDLHAERWLTQHGVLVGYQTVARVLKSRWPSRSRRAVLDIVFNGTVKAQETW